jgi:hypothetical protein
MEALWKRAPLPTGGGRTLAPVLWRRGNDRIDVRSLRRDLAELRAAHADAIELALISAVSNSMHRIITEARQAGWTVTFRRQPHGAGQSVDLDHPTDSAHDCSIPLPYPTDVAEQRSIESNVRLRLRLGQQAA